MLAVSSQVLEGLIRDYIIHLRRERNLSPATVSTYLAAITHVVNDSFTSKRDRADNCGR